MNKTISFEKITQWGPLYGFILLFVMMKGTGFEIGELIENSTIWEMLLVGLGFWIIGTICVSIFLYQYMLSRTYSEFYRRLVNVFVISTIIIFSSEVLDFYWNAVHERSKFYSCVLSGLFFSPIFIGLSLIVQKIFLYLKKGHEITYPSEKE